MSLSKRTNTSKRVVLLCVAIALAAAGIVGCSDNSTATDSTPLLRLEMATAHFDLYCCRDDLYVLPRIADALEGNFDRITSDLECPAMPRVRVYIYPDLDSFHEGVDAILDEDWFVGYCGSPDTIHMVSPLNPGPVHDYNSIMDGLVHEFVHAVFWQIRNSDRTGVQLWLFEGVACYEAGPVPDPIRIRDAVISETVPGLIELNGDFFGLDGYQFSYTIIEYAVHEYGMEAVVRFILSPTDFEGAFGEEMTLEYFENGWMRYLQEHYAG